MEYQERNRLNDSMPPPRRGDRVRYDNCGGIDDDIRALYEALGAGVMPERLERLAEQLGRAAESETAD